MILTVSLGTMVGCSAAGEETEAEPVPEQPAQEEMSAQSAPAEASPGDDQTPEDTTTLTFFKEGEPEEKQAVPALGDGYLLFLPDGEWQQSDADTWTSAVNDQVRLWIAHFADKSMDAVDQELSADGYKTGRRPDLSYAAGGFWCRPVGRFLLLPRRCRRRLWKRTAFDRRYVYAVFLNPHAAHLAPP